MVGVVLTTDGTIDRSLLISSVSLVEISRLTMDLPANVHSNGSARLRPT